MEKIISTRFLAYKYQLAKAESTGEMYSNGQNGDSSLFLKTLQQRVVAKALKLTLIL